MNKGENIGGISQNGYRKNGKLVLLPWESDIYNEEWKKYQKGCGLRDRWYEEISMGSLRHHEELKCGAGNCKLGYCPNFPVEDAILSEDKIKEKVCQGAEDRKKREEREIADLKEEIDKRLEKIKKIEKLQKEIPKADLDYHNVFAEGKLEEYLAKRAKKEE